MQLFKQQKIRKSGSDPSANYYTNMIRITYPNTTSHAYVLTYVSALWRTATRQLRAYGRML